jgi:hypothetical protein
MNPRDLRFLCIASVACPSVACQAQPVSNPSDAHTRPGAMAPQAQGSTHDARLVVPAPTAQATSEPLPPPLGLAEASKRWGDDGTREPSVLYTWTTREQVEAIRAGGPVLQRSFSPTEGFASFHHALSDAARAGDALGKLLWHEAFARVRFAWTNAFGIVSLDGSYGDVLMRITLAQGTSHVAFRQGPGARDLRVREARAEPARLGVARFETLAYREYVLLQESHIARAEVATPSLLADVEEQLRFLQSILDTDGVHAHDLAPFFPGRTGLAARAMVEASIRALERARSTSIAPLDHAPKPLSFALGPARAPIEVLCTLKGVTSRRSAHDPSFGPMQEFIPTCAKKPSLQDDSCRTVVSSTRAGAICLVQPAPMR